MSLCSEEKVFSNMEPLLLQVCPIFLTAYNLRIPIEMFTPACKILESNTSDFRYCELASLKFSNLMYQLMLSLMRYVEVFNMYWN